MDVVYVVEFAILDIMGPKKTPPQASDKPKKTLKAASSEDKADEAYKESFIKMVEEGYMSHQVFNADETSLFWKPNRTFITQEEKSVPGH